MKRFIALLLMLSLISVCAVSCKDNDTDLPETTVDPSDLNMDPNGWTDN